MSEAAPEERVFVTLNDQRWQLVATNKLTFPEVRELKRVSGGMSLVEVEQGIQGVDADAWFAWLFVSIKRAWATLTEADLSAAIGDKPIVALVESVEREAPEVAKPDPPARQPPNATLERLNDNDSGETTPPPSTPDPDGHLTSGTPSE